MTLPSSRALLSSLIARLSINITDTTGKAETTSDNNSTIGRSDDLVTRKNEVNLAALPPQPRQLLLSLHCILPSTLLPALDLLERNCVTRWTLQPPTSETREPVSKPENEHFVPVDHMKIAEQPTTAENSAPPEDRDKCSTDITGNNTTCESPTEKIGQGKIGPSGINEEHRAAAVYYVHSTNPPLIPPRSASSAPPKYEVRTQAWNCTCAAFAFAACNARMVREGNGGEGTDYYSLPLPHAVNMRELGAGSTLVWGGKTLEIGPPPICKHLLACVLAENCALFKSFIEEKYGSKEELAGLAVLWD